MSKIFSQEPVNLGRQTELDIARACTVFMLPFVHSIMEFTPEENLVSGIPFLFGKVIGGPLAAPLFIFLMGVNMIYARNHETIDFLRHGVKFLFVGYALNICRYLLPCIAGYFITGDYEKYIAYLTYYVMENDIMQFAAAAMLFMALAKFLRIPDWLLLIISVLMSLAGMYFNDIDLGNLATNVFVGYFIGTVNETGYLLTDFPLLNWFIVVMAGYLFGKVLIYVKNKNYFYALFSPACLIFTAIYFYFGITNMTGMFGEGEICYYHITIQDSFASIIGVLGIIGFWYIVSKILPDKFLRLLQDISMNINSVYCIHWVILGYVIMFVYAVLGKEFLDVPQIMIISLAIAIASITLAHYWKNFTRKIRNVDK